MSLVGLVGLIALTIEDQLLHKWPILTLNSNYAQILIDQQIPISFETTNNVSFIVIKM